MPRRLWPAVKLLLAVAVVVAVGVHFARLVGANGFDPRPLAAGWPWLVPAGLLYLAAHTVWGSFWWLLLREQGVRAGWAAAVRAYFVSQFGKYVPGKAWVLVLRVGLLRGTPGATTAAVAVTATYETLTSMAAGGLLAAALVPAAGGLAGRQVPAFAAVAAVPLALGAMNRLAARAARRAGGPTVPAPPLGLLAAGLLPALVGWGCLGLSLRCVLLATAGVASASDATPAVGGTTPDVAPAADDFPADLAAVAASYVAGFVVLVAPGGLGARELVLQELLTPRVGGAAAAVLASLVLRLVWTAAEVALAGGWYLLGKGTPADVA
jgi:uncharacterized membrane protein YbhN (UPF0104 family)